MTAQRERTCSSVRVPIPVLILVSICRSRLSAADSAYLWGRGTRAVVSTCMPKQAQCSRLGVPFAHAGAQGGHDLLQGGSAQSHRRVACALGHLGRRVAHLHAAGLRCAERIVHLHAIRRLERVRIALMTPDDPSDDPSDYP